MTLDVRPLDVRPLTPDRLPDLATLFEQGGDPKWCWCTWYRLRNADFSSGGAERNRATLTRTAQDLASEGRAPGLVAYDGDEVVGWVSLGPREDYERLGHSKTLHPVDEAPVWSIVCFVVGRRARGRGVARELLQAGIDYARDHGASLLEAYPVEVPEGERIRLFDDVGRFLAAAAAEQPLLVTLDDVHAADEASLRLLRFLGGAITH